jgi:hypothetical protein
MKQLEYEYRAGPRQAIPAVPRFKSELDSQPVRDAIQIDTVLEERGKRYGNFVGHAKITQDLKWAMHQSRNWTALTQDKREALEMIQHKIGRILNGDPEYKDSWTDIIGYARLVEQTLKD